MDYLDFEICIGSGEDGDYPVHVVRSPAGEKRGTMHLPFAQDDLKYRLLELENAILKSTSTQRDMGGGAEQASVKTFGQVLFEAVLPDEVRSTYRVSREKARDSGMGLRFRLRIEAPDLAALPWEFLYDENEDSFICLSNETPIVRYLELDRPPTPLGIEPPLRVLGMIASPKDRSALNVERERQQMTTALEATGARGQVTLTWVDGQTCQDLQRFMRQGPWHVFHFVGHGGFDAQSDEGMLALAREDGTTDPFLASQAATLLADHPSLRLVVLNACQGAQSSGTNLFSSTAGTLIRRGIPAVIAMQYEITDHGALQFGQTFYESLAEGLPVDAALGEARKSIFVQEKSTEWATPVLHMRSPDGRLFDIAALGAGAVPVVPLPPDPPSKTPTTASSAAIAAGAGAAVAGAALAGPTEGTSAPSAPAANAAAAPQAALTIQLSTAGLVSILGFGAFVIVAGLAFFFMLRSESEMPREPTDGNPTAVEPPDRVIDPPRVEPIPIITDEGERPLVVTPINPIPPADNAPMPVLIPAVAPLPPINVVRVAGYFPGGVAVLPPVGASAVPSESAGMYTGDADYVGVPGPPVEPVLAVTPRPPVALPSSLGPYVQVPGPPVVISPEPRAGSSTSVRTTQPAPDGRYIGVPGPPVRMD